MNFEKERKEELCTFNPCLYKTPWDVGHYTTLKCDASPPAFVQHAVKFVNQHDVTTVVLGSEFLDS